MFLQCHKRETPILPPRASVVKDNAVVDRSHIWTFLLQIVQHVDSRLQIFSCLLLFLWRETGEFVCAVILHTDKCTETSTCVHFQARKNGKEEMSTQNKMGPSRRSQCSPKDQEEREYLSLIVLHTEPMHSRVSGRSVDHRTPPVALPPRRAPVCDAGSTACPCALQTLAPSAPSQTTRTRPSHPGGTSQMDSSIQPESAKEQVRWILIHSSEIDRKTM